MSVKKRAISGVRWTTVGTIGRSIFQLLQVAILTRFLPKEAFGLVAMTLFVIQFSNIFVDMGMTSAILHRQDATQKEYSSIYWLNIFISLILYALLFFATPLISRFYEQPKLQELVPILGTNIILIATGRQHRTIMQKNFQFKQIALIEIISYFFGLISAVYLAINNYGVFSLVFSTLISSFISNILFLIQNFKSNPIRLHFKIKDTKPFLKIGSYTMGSAVLDFFSSEIDILIIGKMLGAEILGVYSLIKQIAVKLFAVMNPIITTVLSPTLSVIQNKKEELKQAYLNVVKYISNFNVPIYLLLIVSSKELLFILYGKSYQEYYVLLIFLLLLYCVTSISGLVGSLQIATGRTDLGLKWTIFRVIISPAVIILGSFISIEAVVIFTATLSLIYIIPLWYIQIKPMINVSLKEYVQPFIFQLLFLVVSSILIGFYTDKIVINSNVYVSAIIKTVLFLILYTGFFFTLDRAFAKGFISMLITFFSVKSTDKD